MGFAPNDIPASLPLQYLENQLNPKPKSIIDTVKNAVSGAMNWLFGKGKIKPDQEVEGCVEKLKDKYTNLVRAYEDFQWSDIFSKKKKVVHPANNSLP